MSEIDDVIKEIQYAEKRFGEFHSSHEGYAIIAEELDELWDEVKKHSHDYHAEYIEAKQVACTAIRFMKMCKRLNNEVGCAEQSKSV